MDPCGVLNGAPERPPLRGLKAGRSGTSFKRIPTDERPLPERGLEKDAGATRQTARARCP